MLSDVAPTEKMIGKKQWPNAPTPQGKSQLGRILPYCASVAGQVKLTHLDRSCCARRIKAYIGKNKRNNLNWSYSSYATWGLRSWIKMKGKAGGNYKENGKQDNTNPCFHLGDLSSAQNQPISLLHSLRQLVVLGSSLGLFPARNEFKWGNWWLRCRKVWVMSSELEMPCFY